MYISVTAEVVNVLQELLFLIYTLEKNNIASFLCILCMLMPQVMSLSIPHVGLCVVYIGQPHGKACS
jgi:hypothetical protein